LEAGALVLADKGLACIDELDKMTPQDRSSLHEAMESQKISIAKAGITATLQSRCSLLAAANPKVGRFTPDESVVSQIDLPPALMSRFDLIFALTDKPDKDNDTRLSSHILNSQRRGEVRNSKEEVIPGLSKEEILRKTSNLEPIYKEDIIRKYVSYAKQNCSPIMSDTAFRMIQDEYISLRMLGAQDDQITVTARQLEAYVRLSEASAKSRLSPVADERDATIAIQLIKYSMDKIARSGSSYDVDMFASEFSKKDRDRMKANHAYDEIKADLRDSESYGGLSDEELIMNHPDIPEQQIRSILSKLSDSNQIYSSGGKWKLVD